MRSTTFDSPSFFLTITFDILAHHQPLHLPMPNLGIIELLFKVNPVQNYQMAC